MIRRDDSYYIEVIDVEYVKNLFGTLLNKIQAIKSTGDLDSARHLVMTFGTKVKEEIHKEIIDRISHLNLPKSSVFITPMLTKENNKIVINQPTDFLKQQLQLYKDYNGNSLKKENRFRF